MKIIRILAIIVVIFAQAQKSDSQTITGGPVTEIVLQGTMSNPIRNDNPIQASIVDSMLQVDFNADLGSVNIVISGAGGVVYNGSVNAHTGYSMQIPLSGLSSGNYTVVINCTYGMMTGSFSI